MCHWREGAVFSEHAEDAVASVIVDVDEARLLFSRCFCYHDKIHTDRFYSAPRAILSANHASIRLSCRPPLVP